MRFKRNWMKWPTSGEPRIDFGGPWKCLEDGWRLDMDKDEFHGLVHDQVYCMSDIHLDFVCCIIFQSRVMEWSRGSDGPNPNSWFWSMAHTYIQWGDALFLRQGAFLCDVSYCTENAIEDSSNTKSPVLILRAVHTSRSSVEPLPSWKLGSA